ncbi:MAG TPA: hypothetical protein VFQ53_05270 [Kofleriaceae bacterium]|nr:hypothetical protein [Kofleriaceae bacterium]
MTRLARWWFAPAPAERLAALRILIGTFGTVWVAARLPEIARVSALPVSFWSPVGVVRVLDGPLDAALAFWIAVATVPLMLAFTLGIGFRVVGPLAAAALLWTLTYRNAWGMPFHTENLLVLHVIALAVSPAADAWALRRAPEAPPRAGYGWAIRLLVALTAATYVLAGIAKLRLGGLAWLDGEVLRNQIAADNARKLLLGDHVAPLAPFALAHPVLLDVFCVMTIALELGAPIALAGGRVARAWVAAAWGFHLGVVLMMNIWFLYPLTGVAFAAVFPVERAGMWVRARRSRGRARTQRSGNARPV